jgi:hypothetical protein
MMVAIAIVALILEIEVLRRRRADFLIEAEKCNAQAFMNRAMAEKHKRLFARLAEVEHARGAEQKAEVAAYFESMARKYRYAAARPWLTVEPEPVPQ